MDKHTPSPKITGIKDKKINQIGIVVRDAIGTAKRYSELFGMGPWRFSDLKPTHNILHDKVLGDEDICIRAATANLGDLQIELLEPMCGPSTHMEFLNKHGQGIHHMSFGGIDQHDEVVQQCSDLGIGLEMQGLLGGAHTFTYLATQKELGTIFEFVKVGRPEQPNDFKPWGKYSSETPGLINLENKKIVQVGIVVKNVEETARRYWELLSLGPWVFIDIKPPHLSDCYLHGVAVRDSDFGVKAAMANLGDLQFELLEPTFGSSTHMEFLKTHGEGIHHVSFGGIPDHDEILSILAEQGIEVESTGLMGGAGTFTYMATQNELGTIWEFAKRKQGAKSTLRPYGTYPPSAD